MSIRHQSLLAHGATALFVLLWSSGAIFAKWGLQGASPFALLILRFTLALAALCLIGAMRGRLLPAPGTRRRVAVIGLLMIAGYTISYLMALASGLTPGVLATLLAVQPLATLWITERRQLSPRRIAGLAIAFAGLVAVVWDSLIIARLSWSGLGFGLLALGCMTVATLMQKAERQSPGDVLPLQYAVGLAACLLIAPFQPLAVDVSLGLVICVLWLGLVISVLASFLYYRMIQSGDLVNVTSLLYLVPPGTALLDWLFLGNAMSLVSLAGMAAILAGLFLVFRRPSG